MAVQTQYQSWKLRRKQLRRAPASLDRLILKEQISILDALIDKHRRGLATLQPTRFPAIDLFPKTFFGAGARIGERVSEWKQAWEVHAQDRVAPLVHDIATVDPQASMRQTRDQAAALPTARAAHSVSASGVLAIQPADSALNADLFSLVFGIFTKLANAIGDALLKCFLEENPIYAPRTFLRLLGAWISGMWDVVCRSDRRKTADYVVDELRQHNTRPELPPPQDPAPAKSRRKKPAQSAPLVAHVPVFIDRRTIMIHDYARQTNSRNARLTPEDANAMVHVARRFVQRQANLRKTPVSEAAQTAPGHSWPAVFSQAGAGHMQRYAEELMDKNGAAFDAFAEEH